jgi:hypothetical protein
MAELRDQPAEVGEVAREEQPTSGLLAAMLRTYPDDPPTLQLTPDSEPVDTRLGGVEAEKVEEVPKGWDAPGVADHEKRPDRGTIHLVEERRAHILDGDEDGIGGGHRHGTGRPEKTEFPASWDDDTSIGHIQSVALDPDSARLQKNGKWVVSGTRDEVELEVVVKPDGQVITGYPLAGPGVVRNPNESET